MKKIDFTICLKESGLSDLKRVIKIIPLRDGGFSILVPKHKAKKGYLAKHKIALNEKRGILESHKNEYSAENKVKISFHRDGFFQFSSESKGTILSGKNKLGEPQGLGLFMKKPLYDFIKTGPTFGVSVWGLSHFENAKNKSNNKNIIFNEEDYYLWPPSEKPWNTYSIEGFLFPCTSYWGKCEWVKNQKIIRFSKINYMSHFPKFKLKSFRFANYTFFFGILVRRVFQNFGNRQESGFMLQSPRDLSDNQLMAYYPPFDNRIIPSNNLDFSLKTN